MTKENFDRMVAIKENFKEIISKNLESNNSYL
jgi:hypothetical protein